MNILLIAGGWSTEREVSLNGAQSIRRALTALGHNVTFFDLLDNFDKLLLEASVHDFAFINLHGSPGEDGLIQAMLDSIKCPYQGSGAAGSFLALHKAAAKQVFRQNGLPTADWQLLLKGASREWSLKIPLPVFVKSNTGGSSLRLGRATNLAELKTKVDEIFATGDDVLIEPALSGKDLTCGILGREALPPVLIEPVAGDFFDYQSKYKQGGAKETCPAPVNEDIIMEAQKLALQAHMSLGLQGYSRADFILDSKDQLTLLEVNTLPGMTATSLVPQEALAIGMDFPVLLQHLIELGLKDHPHS